VLKGLSLTIERGEFFCLLGPSGCGKTTVLNLLAGFEQPTAGAVRVDGRPVTAPGVERTVVFQGDDSLYTWLTAVENVEFGLRLAGVDAGPRRATAERYLDLVGLHGQGHKYPSQLSGGMKQRIQIARALVCESPILLMDEPFAALDAQTRSILQDELIGIWQQTGRTFLFITHDIGESILLANRIRPHDRGPRGEDEDDRPRRSGAPAPAGRSGRRRALRAARRHGQRGSAPGRRAAMNAVSAAKAAPAPPTTAARRRRLGVPAALVPVLSVCALLLVWQVVSARFFPPVLFPTPVMVGKALVGEILSGRLLTDSVVSLRRIFAGFVLGCTIGAGLGLLMGSVSAGAAHARPVHPVRALRPVDLAPLAGVDLVRYWRGLEALPHHLHDDVHRPAQHARRGPQRAAEQDPGGAEPRRHALAAISARHAAREPSWHLHGHARGHGAVVHHGGRRPR
jgi:NitT/TauT family transport system ATP-binding protein